MAEGKEMGKAYVTVNLDDRTEADYVKLKSNLEGKAPIKFGTILNGPDAKDYDKIKADIEGRKNLELGTTLKMPDAGDYDRIKAVTEAKGPISLRVKLDDSEAQQGFQGLESTVDSSTKKSQSSIGQFVTSTAGMWTALGAVLAGPAVALSLGVVAGGFAAIGVMAEKSQPQVTAAFNTMKATGTDVLQSSFQSLTPVIAGSVNTWTGAIRTMGPSFTAISAEIGPGMRIVSDSIAQTAQRDIPQLSAALAQATPMAHSLAGGISDVSAGFVSFLSNLNFTQADAGLSALFRDLGQIETTLGSVVNAIMPLGNSILSSVIPAVLTLVSDLSNGLAPALRVVGGAVTALAPLLNFLSGPNDAVLVAILGYKALSGAVSAVLPVFNSASDAVTKYGNKLNEATGGSEKAIGSFNLMTDAQKKAAVQSAASALASAQEASATAAANLETLKSAATADAASVSQGQLAAARTAATVAAEAETAATEAVNTASEATSFALGPVGIGLGLVAGLMTLFGGSTDKAVPPVQNFTQQLDKLASAAPDAAKGILASDPALSDLVNRAHDAGISVQQLSAALDQGGAAQKSVQDALNGTANSLGSQTVQLAQATTAGKGAGAMATTTAISVKDLSDSIGDNATALGKLTPAQQNLVNQYRNAMGVIGALNPMFGQNADAQKAAGAVGTQVTQLTAEQQTAAASVAKQYGLSVNSVVAAFETLPGAGSTAAGSVQQVTSAFQTSENAALNSEQAVKDYFSQLATNAASANNAAANANHAYQQSVTSVADAEHGAAQAAQAVVDATAGVVTARRAVTDATNSAAQSELSYEASQRAVVDANAGVTAAEKTLAQAQVSETQAQKALTDARQAAVEQLKSLSLQLADQTASEQAAEIKLFDAKATAAPLNITTDNAQSILAAPLTASNEAQKKSALDLVNAENALADTLNTGANLREQVTAANLAGVPGNAQVVSATQALANAQGQVNSAQVGVTKAHQAVADAVNAEQQALYNLGKAQQAIVDAQAGVVKAQKGVSDAVYNEQKARSAVKDAIYNEHQALLSLNDAQATAKKANDLNTTSLDQNTQAGRNNWAQLQTIFTSIPAWVTGISRYKQMVDDTATAFGGSKQAAYDFLVQQGKIPPTFTYDMVAVAKVDSSSWAAAVSSVANTQGQAAKLNMLSHMADGGPVKGPGGPRDDLVPTMLSNDEYVHPADTVSHYGLPFMEAVRNKSLPVKKMASGGLVGYASDVAALGIEGAAYQINVDAQTALGLPHPAGLPAYVPPPASTGGGGGFTAGSGVAGSHAANRSIVMDIFGSQFGWGSAAEQSATDYLEMRESGYNNVAQNPTSTAYGMFQFLNSTWGGYGIPKTSDPTQQSIAGGRYISARYGDPIGAANHERAFNWFDHGGYMLNGPAINNTGKPEMILDPGMTNTLDQVHAMVQGGRGAPAKAGATVNNYISVLPQDAHQTAQVLTDEFTWMMRNG